MLEPCVSRCSYRSFFQLSLCNIEARFKGATAELAPYLAEQKRSILVFEIVCELPQNRKKEDNCDTQSLIYEYLKVKCYKYETILSYKAQLIKHLLQILYQSNLILSLRTSLPHNWCWLMTALPRARSCWRFPPVKKGVPFSHHCQVLTHRGHLIVLALYWQQYLYLYSTIEMEKQTTLWLADDFYFLVFSSHI